MGRELKVVTSSRLHVSVKSVKPQTLNFKL